MSHWLYTDKLWTLAAFEARCKELHKAGADGVLLRVGYRYGKPSEGLINEPAVISQAVDIARSWGLGVAAWFWPHSLHVESQQKVMESQLRGWEPAYFICDAEGPEIWGADEGLGVALCASMREISDAPRVLTSLARIPKRAPLAGPWEILSPQMYTRTREEMAGDVAHWREVFGEEPALMSSSGLYTKRVDGGNRSRSHNELTDHFEDHASIGCRSTFMWADQWWQASRHAAAVNASGMCGPA